MAQWSGLRCPQRSPSMHEDGVLVQPVVHTNLQVHIGLRYPDRHVNSDAHDSEIQLSLKVQSQ